MRHPVRGAVRSRNKRTRTGWHRAIEKTLVNVGWCVLRGGVVAGAGVGGCVVGGRGGETQEHQKDSESSKGGPSARRMVKITCTHEDDKGGQDFTLA